METLDLEVTSRTSFGSPASRRERAAGSLPAVVSRPGSESIAIALNKKDFILTARDKSNTQIFKLNGGDLKDTLVLVKDVQMEPMKGEPLHVDFLELDEKRPVIVKVPVKVEGMPDSVKMGLAMLNQTAYEVALQCLPSQIPTQLTINVTSLKAGESVRASQLELPEGSILKSASGLTVATALVNRRAQSTEDEGAEESTEGEGTPAEGAAAPAPSGDSK